MVWYNCFIIGNHKAIYIIWGKSEMKVSYKKLWKLLIDRDMMKKDLQAKAKISWASVTKMSKNENVSMEILLKVCESLNCRIEDIVEFVPDDVAEEHGA